MAQSVLKSWVGRRQQNCCRQGGQSKWVALPRSRDRKNHGWEGDTWGQLWNEITQAMLKDSDVPRFEFLRSPCDFSMRNTPEEEEAEFRRVRIINRKLPASHSSSRDISSFCSFMILSAMIAVLIWWFDCLILPFVEDWAFFPWSKPEIYTGDRCERQVNSPDLVSWATLQPHLKFICSPNP